MPSLLQWISPRSIIDVGCGIGTWLREFDRFGIGDILGLDGNYVDPDLLRIPAGKFQPRDLAEPIRLDRSFDLALSLEVAEHLPPPRAAGFVADLCRLAPVVLFSAAIPGQGGSHHVNEQWQSYWAGLFADHGYTPFDVLRPLLWSDPAVEFWYAQNLILYVREEAADRYPALPDRVPTGQALPLDLVHPRLFTAVQAQPSAPARLFGRLRRRLALSRLK